MYTVEGRFGSVNMYMYSRESVDSLSRDDVDMPMPPYVRMLHFLAFLGS